MNQAKTSFIVSSTTARLREQTDSYSGVRARSALQEYRQTLRISRKKGDRAEMAWSLVQIAMVFRGQRQYPTALQLLEEAREAFEAEKNEAGLAATYYELSYCNRELDRNALALEYAHNAIKLFQKSGKTLDLGWAYDNISSVYFNLFKRHESLTYAKKARAIYSSHKSNIGLAWNACHLGNLHLEMGFYPQAEKLYSEAIKRFKILKHQQGLAWASLGMATVKRGQCKFSAALEHLKKSKELYKTLQLKDRFGWCLLHEAAIKRMEGKDEEAMLINKKALQIFGPLRNHDGVAWSMFQVGQIMRDRGQFLKSWQTSREALNLHTDIANRKGIGWLENDWGKTYLQLNDIPHARECFVKAKVISEQLDDAHLKVDVNKNLASLYLDEGLLQKASSLMDYVGNKTQEIQNKNTEAENYFEKARYYVIMGELKKARHWINIVDTLVERHNLHRLKPRLGLFLGEILMLEGKFKNAQIILNDAVNMAKKFSQRQVAARARLGLIQELIRTESDTNLSALLSLVERDVRALSSRKIKAKFLLVKGLVEFRMNEKIDKKVFDQAIEALKSSGLAVLHKKALSFLIKIYEQAGMEREKLLSKNDMKNLLEKESADLHLVRPVKDPYVLPVSLIS